MGLGASSKGCHADLSMQSKKCITVIGGWPEISGHKMQAEVCAIEDFVKDAEMKMKGIMQSSVRTANRFTRDSKILKIRILKTVTVRALGE